MPEASRYCLLALHLQVSRNCFASLGHTAQHTVTASRTFLVRKAQGFHQLNTDLHWQLVKSAFSFPFCVQGYSTWILQKTLMGHWALCSYKALSSVHLLCQGQDEAPAFHIEHKILNSAGFGLFCEAAICL